MAKFYIISPDNVPLNQCLFPAFKSTFEKRGHSFVGSVAECDVVLFDLHSRIGDYADNDIYDLINSDKFVVTFDEWDRGNMSPDQWPHPLTAQQYAVFSHISENNISVVNFCRLLDKTKEYPPYTYPYEKSIAYEEPILTADELFNRPYDVCFIANSAPSRQAIADAFIADGRMKCIISLGANKLPFDDFVREHKRAKCFVSSAAGGFTDERMQCLFSVAAPIKQINEQLLLHPYVAGENCLGISTPPTKEELDVIYETVNDKQKLYNIYSRSHFHMKSYYTPEYIAGDIVSKIEKHLL